MKILHITSHMGGGVGSVIMGWMERVKGHSVLCLDYMNDKAKNRFAHLRVPSIEYGANSTYVPMYIEQADIVVVHYWDHPMLYDFLDKPLPECRMVVWCHKNFPVPQKYLDYPDLFIDTSPVQGHGRHIWSTVDISRFLEIKPKAHEGFNVGYIGTVDYKKMHENTMGMCVEISKAIPGVHFTFIGDRDPHFKSDNLFTFTGKVDDVAPYLAEMDVFGYPLRPDHYGTCEQVLGEAMAAGVVPVTMDNPTERLITLQPSGLSYVDSVVSLYNDPGYRKELSGNMRDRARRVYSIEKTVKEWNKVFVEMMQGPKRSHG